MSHEYLEEVIKAYEHFFFHYTSSDLFDREYVGDSTSSNATRTCRNCCAKSPSRIKGTTVLFCRWVGRMGRGRRCGQRLRVNGAESCVSGWRDLRRG